jgi:uncharacterized membrane protein (Fun14 family)
MQRNGFDASLVAPVVLGTVIRATLACVLAAIIGCAVGALLRSPMAAVSALVGIFVLSHSALGPLQVVTRGTPLVWLANLDEFFPSAVIAVQIVPPNAYWPQYLVGNVLQASPDQAMAVLAGWAVITATAAAIVFRRRSV